MVKVVVPPAVEPVTLAELKSYMKHSPSVSSQDSILTMFLQSGREEAEKYQNVAYCEQTLQIALDNITSGAIVLPRPPFKSLVSVVCYDVNDNPTDITSSFAINDVAFPAEIKMKDGQVWPNVNLRNQNPILITYKAGSDTIPARIKLAILFYATWFSMHPDTDLIPKAFYNLLSKDRVIPV